MTRVASAGAAGGRFDAVAGGVAAAARAGRGVLSWPHPAAARAASAAPVRAQRGGAPAARLGAGPPRRAGGEGGPAPGGPRGGGARAAGGAPSPRAARGVNGFPGRAGGARPADPREQDSVAAVLRAAGLGANVGRLLEYPRSS